VPTTVICSVGLSASALATLSRPSLASALSSELPGSKVMVLDSPLPPPPRPPGQQAERRRDGLDDQVDDGLPDQRADAELRVVERAAERQVDVDHAVAVGQQGHRQLDGQAVGRARHFLAELQLVEHQLVGGGELAVGRTL
jgi:hypothetical protein